MYRTRLIFDIDIYIIIKIQLNYRSISETPEKGPRNINYTETMRLVNYKYYLLLLLLLTDHTHIYRYCNCAHGTTHIEVGIDHTDTQIRWAVPRSECLRVFLLWTISTNAQLFQTCGVCSASHLQLRTYLPSFFGTFTVSITVKS